MGKVQWEVENWSLIIIPPWDETSNFFAGLPEAWTPKGTIEIDCKQLEEAVSEGDVLT